MFSELTTTLTAPNGHEFDQPLGLFINNQWMTAESGEKIISVSPIDEQEICSVHSAGPADVDNAVRAARNAYRTSWKRFDPSERGQLLWKLADLTQQHAETLATIDTWDSGKSYQSTLHEDVGESAGALRHYAGYADKIRGSVVEPHSTKLAYTSREPLGVCALIIPWNYPLVNLTWKIAPALAAGNTVVVKLAEQTPLSALYFANLVLDAGFPPGVVNIINGLGAVAGSALVKHPEVNMISFTGSTLTGRKIMQEGAATMKQVVMEAGGKSPLIIFEDSDLEQAARWAHLGIMGNAGQICSATSRILVQRSVYDRFVEIFCKTIASLSKVGDPFDLNTYQGPQVNRSQYEKVLAYVEAGKREGATLRLGGEPYTGPKGPGLYIAPTVFTDVTPEMTIWQEEIFGPFVIITPFSKEEEAVDKANDTPFGLGAAIFTKDIVRAHAFAKEIESGTVWINSSNDSDYRIPFGGMKQSGNGREWGEEGLLEFTTVKAVHINLGTTL